MTYTTVICSETHLYVSRHRRLVPTQVVTGDVFGGNSVTYGCLQAGISFQVFFLMNCPQDQPNSK